MTGGTLTLKYYTSEGSGSTRTIEIGSVTTIQESFQKSCTVVPLVSMDVADTFAIDTKTAKVINIQFQRKQGRNGMNNATWIGNMITAMNRWQCRTDGFTLTYDADSDNPYIAEINENGYVKSFTYSLTQGEPDYIKGSIEFHVGTMYVNNAKDAENERVYTTDFSIKMTDSAGTLPYTILSNSINCVDSYTLYGGPEYPFEYIKLTVPRNRLSSVAPSLTEADGIVAGMNRLELDAIGRSSMTVTKCKLSDNYYTITAYCNADRLRGCTLAYDETGTPNEILIGILSNATGEYPVRFSESEGTLILEYNTPDVGTVTFSAGTNVWRVLQICAMLMGCRIFFANNCAYVVDMRKANVSRDAIQTFSQGIDLFDADGPVRTVGEPSLGDEGVDTVINSITIDYTQVSLDDEGGEVRETASETYRRESSIEVFNERSGGKLYLEELIVQDAVQDEEGNTTQEAVNQPSVFAENYMDYRDEPQQSIEFTVKEMYKDDAGYSYWSPFCMPAARASEIIDENDDVTITNISKINGSAKPQKLCMSTYERSYPKGTTTYVFGAITTIDLASSTSQINSALGI